MKQKGQSTLNRALTVATAGITVVVVIFVIGNVAGTTQEAMHVNDNRSVTLDNVDSASITELVDHEDALVHMEYDMSSSDNVTVLLNSVTIVDGKSISGTGTVENTYSEIKDNLQGGTNKLEVQLDGGTGNVNSITTDFWIQGVYKGEREGIFEQIVSGVYDAFSMMPVVFIVMIAGLIITVLLGWTGIAGGGARS